jgi:uncharacterized protein (DUF1800 family)
MTLRFPEQFRQHGQCAILLLLLSLLVLPLGAEHKRAGQRTTSKATTQHYAELNQDQRYAAVARFLESATWGPNYPLIQQVAQSGEEAFLEAQFNTPKTVWPRPQGNLDSVRDYQRLFYFYAVNRPDQTRQRMAFALSQIVVVSAVEVNKIDAFHDYLNTLQDHAFGNYLDLLRDIALSPAMGDYLDNVNNAKPEPDSGLAANENWARELVQLFALGVDQLKINGEPEVDGNGEPIPAYTEDDVKQLALAMTGWTYPTKPGAKPRRRNPRYYVGPMVAWESSHDTSEKTFLGVTLPANQTAAEDMEAAIQAVFAHPNVGPFVATRLIRSLVKSNPSPEYIERVARVFNNNGNGVRGDLRAVAKAILLDSEAREMPEFTGRGSSMGGSAMNTGHLKEPVLFVIGVARAFEMQVRENNALSTHAERMGQRVLFSPSVFNYFSPLNRIAGTELYGPEFQIHTPSTAIERANFVNNLVRRRLGSGINVSFDALDSYADDAASMVDILDLVLTHRTLPPNVKQAIVRATEVESRKDRRIQQAVYLVVSSPWYSVAGLPAAQKTFVRKEPARHSRTPRRQ